MREQLSQRLKERETLSLKSEEMHLKQLEQMRLEVSFDASPLLIWLCFLRSWALRMREFIVLKLKKRNHFKRKVKNRFFFLWFFLEETDSNILFRMNWMRSIKRMRMWRFSIGIEWIASSYIFTFRFEETSKKKRTNHFAVGSNERRLGHNVRVSCFFHNLLRFQMRNFLFRLRTEHSNRLREEEEVRWILENYVTPSTWQTRSIMVGWTAFVLRLRERFLFALIFSSVLIFLSVAFMKFFFFQTLQIKKSEEDVEALLVARENRKNEVFRFSSLVAAEFSDWNLIFFPSWMLPNKWI